MKKPVIILKDNLLMPIRATENRINEIKEEINSVSSPICLNGLFLMLVSYIESMQKEVLRYYLKYHPEKITDNKTIEIDKSILLDNEDFYLTESVVSEYIAKMPNWQLTKIFYKALKINKPNNDLNSSIEDIRKRRNELIHKNLTIDFKHKWEAEKKFIDIDYLNYSLNQYDNYLNYLKTEISKKYHKYTKINVLKNLWHYTFNTPLCANFEDYWHINFEKDSISAWKESKHETRLSSSETFMLGIWRSQVSGYKVDFVNMGNLDQNKQSKLYMFLKLSNDILLY